MFRLVPILAGVIAGYVLAAMMGLVDFAKIANALVCRTALYHPGSQLGGGAVYAAGGDCPCD